MCRSKLSEIFLNELGRDWLNNDTKLIARIRYMFSRQTLTKLRRCVKIITLYRLLSTEIFIITKYLVANAAAVACQLPSLLDNQKT